MNKLIKVVIALVTIATVFTVPLIKPLKGHAEDTITYDFTGVDIPEGENQAFTVDAATMQLFRTDDAHINSFVTALAAKYNKGNTVINESAEFNYIKAVLNGVLPGGLHRASYVTMASPNGALAYGNGTYIDVNKTTQTLTYFKGGNAVFSTPIVTGSLKAGHDTPSGVYTVQYKQRDRVLKGEDYESPVKYWMRFTGNIGLHDANWRSSFGGDIYVKKGSHGCVNIPPANMPFLYSECPVGTVVVVHEDEAILAQQALLAQQQAAAEQAAAAAAAQQAAEQAALEALLAQQQAALEALAAQQAAAAQAVEDGSVVVDMQNQVYSVD